MNLIQNIYKILRKLISGSPLEGELWGALKGGYRGALMLFLLFALSACDMVNEQIDEPTPENPTPTQTDFYLSLNITLPTSDSTRSTTTDSGDNESSSDQLKGQDNENKVESAHIFFFDAITHNQLCKFFAYKKLEYTSPNGSNDSWTITAKIEPNELRELVGKSFNLYILANDFNFTSGQGNNEEERFLNGTFEILDLNSSPVQPFGRGAAGQICPMANKECFTIEALKSVKLDGLEDYELLKALGSIFNNDYKVDNGKLWKITDKNNIGTLSLERKIARIDYKDGSKTGIPYTYELGSASDGTKLKIASMQLFNVGKKAYTFRHTQAVSVGDGSKMGELQVFGRERGTETGYYNWIADCDWDAKTRDLSNNFYFNQLICNNADEDIWELTNGNGTFITTDQLASWKDSQNMDDGYVRWHYLSENTLPSTDVMNNTYATGVEFLMQVCDSNGDPINKQEGEPSYRINLEGGKYKEVEWREPIKEGDKEILPGGYYIPYRWLIRHNDESDSAPMRMGIVRNNVYRLSVTGITNVPQPHEPDNSYLSVDIKVLAWAKRDITVTW